MRVTISFDVDAGRAREVMKALIVSESVYLSEALVTLASTNSTTAQSTSQEVATSLEKVVTQLSQYSRMLKDLENLSHQQNLPQPAEELDLTLSQPSGEVSKDIGEALKGLKDQVEDIQKFTSFMEKVSDETSQEG